MGPEEPAPFPFAPAPCPLLPLDVPAPWLPGAPVPFPLLAAGVGGAERGGHTMRGLATGWTTPGLHSAAGLTSFRWEARATLCAAGPEPPSSAAASARPVVGASASATSIAAAAARRPTAAGPRRRTRGDAAGCHAEGLPSSMLRPGPVLRT